MVGERWKRVLGRTLAIVTLAAVLVPAAPVAAQANSATWNLVSNNVKFKRGQQAYRLSVAVQENVVFGTSTETVRVSIVRARNPKGIRHAQQRHTFVFSALEGTFGGTPKLSSATIMTGQQLGDFGRLSLTFTKNAPLQQSCGGHKRSRAGTLSGSLELDTGSSRLATVRAVPKRATLSYIDDQCQEGFVVGGPCSTPTRTVATFPDPTAEALMVAEKPVRSKAATVTVLWSDDLNDERTRRVDHELVVRLPTRKVKVAKNLSSATVRGAKRTWLTGKLQFTAQAPRNTSDPSVCGFNFSRQETSHYRHGQVDGVLRVKSWLGSNVHIRTVPASAGKIVVRKS